MTRSITYSKMLGVYKSEEHDHMARRALSLDQWYCFADALSLVA